MSLGFHGWPISPEWVAAFAGIRKLIRSRDDVTGITSRTISQKLFEQALSRDIEKSTYYQAYKTDHCSRISGQRIEVQFPAWV